MLWRREPIATREVDDDSLNLDMKVTRSEEGRLICKHPVKPEYLCSFEYKVRKFGPKQNLNWLHLPWDENRHHGDVTLLQYRPWAQANPRLHDSEGVYLDPGFTGFGGHAQDWFTNHLLVTYTGIEFEQRTARPMMTQSGTYQIQLGNLDKDMGIPDHERNLLIEMRDGLLNKLRTSFRHWTSEQIIYMMHRDLNTVNKLKLAFWRWTRSGETQGRHQWFYLDRERNPGLVRAFDEKLYENFMLKDTRIKDVECKYRMDDQEPLVELKVNPTIPGRPTSIPRSGRREQWGREETPEWEKEGSPVHNEEEHWSGTRGSVWDEAPQRPQQFQYGRRVQDGTRQVYEWN
jgi:hypothetical protein